MTRLEVRFLSTPPTHPFLLSFFQHSKGSASQQHGRHRITKDVYHRLYSPTPPLIYHAPPRCADVSEHSEETLDICRRKNPEALPAMTAQPAFTPVAARRTLAKDPSPTATPKTTTNFSSAVVDYVQRAFFEFNRQKDTPLFVGITDKDIRAKLSSIVNQATAEGVTNARDWSAYPLPHEFVLEERRQAAMTAAPVQNSPLANMNHAYGQPPATWAPEPASSNKKRKSADQEVAGPNGQAVTPPWKKANTKSLAERITGKNKNQEKTREEIYLFSRAGSCPRESGAVSRRQRGEIKVCLRHKPYTRRSRVSQCSNR